MNIKVWSDFSKRINSTKRPSGDGTSITVRLKENTSMVAPVFILTGNDFHFNYVQAFGRFYFVSNVQSVVNDMSQIECAIDVLATYKEEIGSYVAYVERSASNYDTAVIDSLISAQQKVVSAAKADTAISNYSTTGSYALRMQGKGGIDQYIGSYEGISTILYQAYNIDNFIDQYNEIEFDNVTGGIEQLRKILFSLGYDPSRYIVSLLWFPFDIGGTGTNECYMGFYDLGPIGGVTKSGLQTIIAGGSVSIPSRYFGDFRDYDNTWSRYSLYFPGVGEVSLDASSLSNGLNYSLRVDAITGASTVVLTDNSGAHISTLAGTMGVSQQIGFASPQSAMMNAIASQIASYGSSKQSYAGGSAGVSGKY